MTRSSEKGKDLERRVAKMFTDAFKIPFMRVPHSGMMKSIPECGDVYSEDFPYCIECKKRAIITLEDVMLKELAGWWKQAVRQATPCKKRPMLVISRDRGGVFLITRREQAFLDMAEDLEFVLFFYNTEPLQLTNIQTFAEVYKYGHQQTDR